MSLDSAERLRQLSGDCRNLATMLSAGLNPAQALHATQCDLASWRSGTGLERTMASMWQLTLERGYAAASTMNRLAAFVAALADSRRDAELYLVGPAMTTRLVLWLPLVSVLLATGAGFAVLPFLFGTALGWMLIVSAVLLIALAKWWSARLLRRAVRGSWAAGLPATVVGLAVSAGLAPVGEVELAELIDADGYFAPAAAVADAALAWHTLERAQQWGVPAAALLVAEAELAQRRELERQREANQKLAVSILIPLGVCVLPAFVLVGVVPVVAVMLSSTGTLT